MKTQRIFERELNACFQTFYGYAFAAFVLLTAGIYTVLSCLKGGSADFTQVPRSMTFTFLIAIPILTMRTFAEERRQKTELLLYALPVRISQIVAGKFLGLCGVIALPVLIMALYPPLLRLYGNVDLPAAYCALIGFYLLGISLASIGLFLSAQTDSQAAAAGMSFAATLLLFFLSTLAKLVSNSPTATLAAAAILLLLPAGALYAMTKSWRASACCAAVLEAANAVCYFLLPERFSGGFPALVRRLSVFDRYYVFLDGIFDWTGVCYLLSVTVFFLLLTVLSLEKRRWSE